MRMKICKIFTLDGEHEYPLHMAMRITPRPYTGRRMYNEGIGYCKACDVKFSKETFLHNRVKKSCVCCGEQLRHHNRGRILEVVKRIG